MSIISTAECKSITIPFHNNAEFLKAKKLELSLFLEYITLQQTDQSNGYHESTNNNGHKHKPVSESEMKHGSEILLVDYKNNPDILQKLNWQKYKNIKSENNERLSLSQDKDIPYLKMVSQCKLDELDQEIIMLLFYGSISNEIRKQLNYLKTIDHRETKLLTIGFLLQILCPEDFNEQLQARKHFSVESPLLKHNLIQFERNHEGCSSILNVEVYLPQRVVNWISDDQNIYMYDMPFIVENPKDSLDNVILPKLIKSHIVSIFENYDRYIQKRKSCGVDQTITYGKAFVILEYGSPGTGKTLFARALSNYTKRPLISPTQKRTPAYQYRDPSEFIPVLFREAQLRKGIVFIDECEHICGKDSHELGILLTELEHTDAIVILATNKPNEIAPAMDRRISLKIPFEIPDTEARLQIWRTLLPEQIPLDSDINLSYLASTYPFAGGYIKNAILLGINHAITRSVNGDFILNHNDLEDSIKTQEQHVTGVYKHLKVIKPQEDLNDCLLASSDIPKVINIIHLIKCHDRMKTKCKIEDNISSNLNKGFKILLHVNSITSGLQVTQAIAKKTGVAVGQVSLNNVYDQSSEILYSKDYVERLIGYLPIEDIITIRNNQLCISKEEQIDLREIFSLASKTEYIIVFTDNQGLFANLDFKENDAKVRTFFDLFAEFPGIAFIITASKKGKLPRWARKFHEIISLTEPEKEIYAYYWSKLFSEENISIQTELKLENYISDYALSIDDILAVTQRIALLKGSQENGTPVQKELLESAILKIKENTQSNSKIFG